MNRFNFKISFILVAFLIISNLSFAQGVLPVHRYIIKGIPMNFSFGYSLRKLNASYTGFAVRVRASTTGAEGDVGFDSNGVVGTGSTITVTKQGTSTYAVGTVVPFSTFKGTQSLFVSIWYNQGDPANNAIQATTTNQPELQLNTAGTGNTLPSIYFSGNKWLILNKPIEQVVANGINGTFCLALKTISNINQFTFGYRNPTTDWRWSFHINWSNTNVYFDAGEVCCAANRWYPNATNVNLWKQYTFIRGTSYKTARINRINTQLNNSPATSTSQTGGNFGIGWVPTSPDLPFQGYMSEILMYNFDKSQAEVTPIELNQMAFWQL